MSSRGTMDPCRESRLLTLNGNSHGPWSGPRPALAAVVRGTSCCSPAALQRDFAVSPPGGARQRVVSGSHGHGRSRNRRSGLDNSLHEVSRSPSLARRLGLIPRPVTCPKNSDRFGVEDLGETRDSQTQRIRSHRVSRGRPRDRWPLEDEELMAERHVLQGDRADPKNTARRKVQNPITSIIAAPRHQAWCPSRDSTGSAVETVREVQVG